MPVKAGLLLFFSALAFGQGWGAGDAKRLWLQGRFPEAEEQLARLRDLDRHSPWGEDSTLVFEAEFETERGRLGQAAALIKETKKRVRLGNEPIVERRRARLLLAAGRFAEAWQAALGRRKWDGKDVRTLKLGVPMDLVTLGEVLLARGEFAAPIPVFEKAKRGAKNDGWFAVEWFRAQNGTAIAHLSLGSLQTASDAAALALSQAEREWGAASIPAMDALDTIGLVRLSESKPDEADAALSRSRAWREDVYGMTHPKVAGSYLHAAMLAAARKDSAGATRLAAHAIQIERALAVGPNGRWALALLSAAETLAAVGRSGDAKACFKSADPVLERELGPAAPRLAAFRNQHRDLVVE
jgi:hypothetical protein